MKLTYRHVLPTLALVALAGVSAARAQTPQKKGGSPSTSTARPTAAPAATQSSPPAPAPIAAAPARPTSAASSKAAAAPANTELKGDRARFGLGGGMAAPMSSLGQAFSVGYSGGVFVEGRPAGFPIGLRGDVNYSTFAVKTGVTSPDYTVLQFTGAAVYRIPSGKGGSSPFFATGGIGLYRNKGAGPSQTDFGQNLGLGFDISKRLFNPFVEGRFHFFNQVESFALSAGFRF